MEDTVLQEELLLLTDWHTDHLYVTAIAVVAPFSRIFCDAELFTDDALEVMAARGMGVLYTQGTALVVDCHSYPDAPLLRDLDRTPGRPAFSIGTDPVHTPPELIAAAVAYFAAQGHPLAIDRPYRGTLVPTPLYGTDARVRSIMLEVNRALYLQPGSDQRSPGYARTRELVQGFLGVMRELG